MPEPRALYARSMHGLRSVLAKTGVLKVLDRNIDRRPVHFLRSQFAIYDFEDLAFLDSPWWSYGAIDAVDEWLSARQRTRAFEWGAGSSTMWLGKRVNELLSIEHDAPFADAVRPLIPDHVSVHTVVPEPSANPSTPSGRRGMEHLDFGAYVDAISSFDGEFDLICIDGRARTQCLEAALGRLATDGLIVFDNSDRSRYRDGLEQSPLDERSYRGWAPALPIKSSTSLLRPSRQHSPS